jgi:hypothetical protein
MKKNKPYDDPYDHRECYDKYDYLVGGIILFFGAAASGWLLSTFIFR